MPGDSFVHSLLLKGKSQKLKELCDLAAEGRTPAQARSYQLRAERIVLDIAEIDDRLMSGGTASSDYRTGAMHEVIVDYIARVQHPVTQDDLTQELIRGQFPGYRDERKMAIRVGRCIRAYVFGRAKENPKLKIVGDLVGLPDWPDERFKR